MARRAPDLKIKAVIGGKDELTPTLRRLRRVSRATFRGISKAARGASLGIGSMAVASVVAGRSMYNMTVTTAKELDAISKFSRGLGISTEELSRLRFAADRSGLSVEAFDRVMNVFVKGLGEAKAGTGTMLAFLKRVSPVFAKQIVAVDDVSEAFTLYLRAIEQTDGAQKKSALAAAAFGVRAGPKMARLLDQGIDGLNALKKESDRLGITLSTGAGIAAEGFVDTLTNFDGALKGLKRTIGADLGEQLKPLLEQATEWIVLNREEIGTQIATSVKEMAAALREVDWRQAASDIMLVSKTLLGMIGYLAKALKLAQDFGEAIGQMVMAEDQRESENSARYIEEQKRIKEGKQKELSPWAVGYQKEMRASNVRFRRERAETETEGERLRRVLGNANIRKPDGTPGKALTGSVDVNVNIQADGATVTKTSTKARGGGVGKVTAPVGNRGM